ncbi:MAG TPA: FHA domain-containing protein, partial [Myxococcaceae bacterium]|nr:FHA domain-containing protein [Myxococcaceae bacterium]
MKLIIEDDEGRKTVVPFVREEITIGRQEGNTIRLTERNVSRRHARLLRVNGHVMVEDLGSYNGIRINGERVSGQTPIHDGDLIQIGDYDLAIQTEGQQPKDLVPSTQDVVQTRRNVPDEPETEADAPIISPTEVVDGEEDTSPSAKDAGRRQSTSVIRVSQLEAERSQRQLADLDPEEAPRLFVLNTELAGREFSCIRTELRLGRTDDNDISLDHRSLSRTHAKVVREDNGEWRVLDMQSANGVKVNGEPYAQATLRFGDVIELGHVKLKFLAPGEAFRFVPGAYDDNAPAAPKRGKLLPAVVAVVVVLGLIAGSLMLPPVRAALGMGGETPEPSPR